MRLLLLHPEVECIQDGVLENVVSVSSDEVLFQLGADGESELLRDWVVTLKKLVERFRCWAIMARRIYMLIGFGKFITSW